MTRRKLTHTGIAAMLSAACSPPSQIDFIIQATGEGDPLGHATAIALEIEKDSLPVPGSRVYYSPESTTLDLPPVPFGSGYRFRIEVLGGEILLAHGRSFEFSIAELGMNGDPRVFLGSLGRFAPRDADLGGIPRCAAPTAHGLLAMLESGRVVSHRFAASETEEILEDGSAEACYPVDGALVVHTASGKLLLVDESGVRDSLTLSSERAHRGAASGYDRRRGVLFLAGGHGSERAVTRIEIIDGHFASSASLRELGEGRRGGVIHVLHGLDGRRAIVLAGAENEHGKVSDELVFLSESSKPRHVPLPPDVSLSHATTAPGESLQLLLLGGRHRKGAPMSRVELLALNPDREPHIVRVSPGPPPLFIPREGGHAISWAPGLVLLLGGRGENSESEPHAEIVDVRDIPGAVAPTGMLPEDFIPHVALSLDDGTLHVSDGKRGFSYVPPRGQR